jgi:hypothetical protein
VEATLPRIQRNPELGKIGRMGTRSRKTKRFPFRIVYLESRVRVIVLVPDAEDISEAAWTKAASASPAFDFLKDAAEEVYTAADGKPFNDQG